MTGVAATVEPRGALEHDDATAAARGGNRGAQRGIAAPEDDDVEGFA